MEVLDNYIKSAPNSQNALDIFKGEWASMFPGSVSLAAGTVPLFEDNRVAWAIEKFNGVQSKHILEFGPLEAGHTYMLEKHGYLLQLQQLKQIAAPTWNAWLWKKWWNFKKRISCTATV